MIEPVIVGLTLQISELQTAHAALMVSNEELVTKHQRHLSESQKREKKLVEDLENSRSGLKKCDVELKACKEVIDAANETIVLKVSFAGRGSHNEANIGEKMYLFVYSQC